MATIKLDLIPFDVPRNATICLPGHQAIRYPQQLGGGVAMENKPLPTVPLKDLAPDELEAMASTWLANLFASVNRASPFVLTGKSPA